MKFCSQTLLAILIISPLPLTVGCQPVADSKNGAPAVSQTAATPDDAAAVAALETAGCSLKKDASGQVTEIAVSADEDFSEALKNLAGIPNVTVARFGGPGMNDVGMQSLSNLKKLKRLDLTDCSADDWFAFLSQSPSICRCI